jgi:HD-like signal output (HDOD) protein/CheY-like chemotaxis protein
MKQRILFVDDEPLVLQGLQRMLRPMRPEWEMDFATSGAAALECLAASPCDVVVADMRMPGMNGAQLLNEVMRRHPQTVRLILSGHADEDLILKCVGITHQYLSKPCDSEALKAAVRRASAVGVSLNNPRLKQLVCQVDRLPSVPALYMEMVERLQNPEINLSDIATTISRDIAMTAKILKLVNSAFFGLRREITGAEEAVAYLGVNTLKTLVLSIHAFTQFEGKRAGTFSLEQLWAHSLQVASLARRIAQAGGMPATLTEETFVAGMLHDVGQLVLAANLGSQYDAVLERVRQERLPLESVEGSVFGTTHAEVGGYLLGLWGLPVPVVEGIALHHQPRLCPAMGFSPLTAVHVAEALCQSVAPDLEYLAALGLTEQIPAWQSAAAETPVPTM